ncbi:LacI family DNA-binding transcriptional regulator [Arthrobacter flavus]
MIKLMTKEAAPFRLIDVATRAGVSLATASRSLSGSDGVSKERAEYVRGVALQMGYVANAHARSLAGGAASTVGLIVHEIADPYFTEIASGVLRIATRQSRTVQISQSQRTPEGELLQIRALRAQRVGAIILAGSGYTDAQTEKQLEAELGAFQASGGRVAVIGRHQITADAVLPDNRAGGLTIASHLIELGHRRIVVLAGPADLNTVSDRLAGIMDAFADAGITSDTVTVIHTPFTREGGLTGTDQALHDCPAATAIIALNDVMAIGSLSALRRRGIRIPEDVSVSGFDDITVAADVGPSLTTIRIPMTRIGEQAMEMVLAAKVSRPRRKKTGHELVIRDSTGPVRT